MFLVFKKKKKNPIQNTYSTELSCLFLAVILCLMTEFWGVLVRSSVGFTGVAGLGRQIRELQVIPIPSYQRSHHQDGLWQLLLTLVIQPREHLPSLSTVKLLVFPLFPILFPLEGSYSVRPMLKEWGIKFPFLQGEASSETVWNFSVWKTLLFSFSWFS